MEDLGAEAAPAAAPRGLRLFLLGRVRRSHVRMHDRTVLQHGGQIRLGLQVGPQVRPDALVAPGHITAIDRFPLPVRGRPRAPRCAHPCHPAQRFHERRPCASLPTRRPEQVSSKERIRSHWVSVIGGRPRANTPRVAGREANRGRAGCPRNGASGARTRPPAMTHTRNGAGVFRTWRRLGSGCNPKPIRPNR